MIKQIHNELRVLGNAVQDAQSQFPPNLDSEAFHQTHTKFVNNLDAIRHKYLHFIFEKNAYLRPAELMKGNKRDRPIKDVFLFASEDAASRGARQGNGEIGELEAKLETWLVAFYKEKVRELLKKNRNAEALKGIKRILSVDIINPFAREQLQHLRYKKQNLKGELKRLDKTFHFKCLSRFGRGFLKKPVFVHSTPDGLVLVSDFQLNAVLVFDAHGEYKCRIRSAFHLPYGIFEDYRGNIYICDHGSSQVIVFDRSMHPIDRLDIKGMLDDGKSIIYPGHGCICDGFLFLILWDQAGLVPRIVKIDMGNPCAIDYVSISKMQYPVDIQVVDAGVHAADAGTGKIYGLNRAGNEFVDMNISLPQGKINTIAPVNGDLFINKNTAICKIRSNKKVFDFDLRRILPCRNNSFNLTYNETSQQLMVSDFENACVHCFEV